jgi:hypothetical protein
VNGLGLIFPLSDRGQVLQAAALMMWFMAGCMSVAGFRAGGGRWLIRCALVVSTGWVPFATWFGTNGSGPFERLIATLIGVVFLGPLFVFGSLLFYRD